MERKRLRMDLGLEFGLETDRGNHSFLVTGCKEMAGTTRLELATSAVTEHLDLEFQELTGTRRNTKSQQEREGNS
jgi:hypothetical protein